MSTLPTQSTSAGLHFQVWITPGFDYVASFCTFPRVYTRMDAADATKAIHRPIIAKARCLLTRLASTPASETAALECWYVAHRGLRLYIEVIMLTLWAVAFKDNSIAWRWWPTLPPLPPALSNRLPAA